MCIHNSFVLSHEKQAFLPGENLMSEISCFLWWKLTTSSNVSELTTTKLPVNKKKQDDVMYLYEVKMKSIKGTEYNSPS